MLTAAVLCVAALASGAAHPSIVTLSSDGQGNLNVPMLEIVWAPVQQTYTVTVPKAERQERIGPDGKSITVTVTRNVQEARTRTVNAPQLRMSLQRFSPQFIRTTLGGRTLSNEELLRAVEKPVAVYLLRPGDTISEEFRPLLPPDRLLLKVLPPPPQQAPEAP